MSRAWLNGVLGLLALVLVSLAVWQWSQRRQPPEWCQNSSKRPRGLSRT